MRLGASAFYGNTRHGAIHREETATAGKSRDWVTSLDADYQHGGWIIDGSLMNTNGLRDNSFGLEAGYDVLGAADDRSLSLIPFVRYDGVFRDQADHLNRYSVGFNFMPLANLMLKGEWAWNHIQGLGTRQSADVSIGYTLAF